MRRNISDWLTYAAAATEPTEAARCLDEAIALAEACYEWRALLRGVATIPLVSRERVSDLATRTLELALAEREIWGFRDVATLRATRLDDPTGARVALEAGVAALREPRPDGLGALAALDGDAASARGYEWVLLGQGFAEILGDTDAQRRCLEAGRDKARARRNADDLCDIAREWATSIDRDAGVALLREAEAMASDGSVRPWTLANAWHSLGDSEAVHRVLDAALRSATSTDAALHVARAWASHHEVDEVARAHARAEELASTAEDWLAIAELAFDVGLGEDSIRRALLRAEGLAAEGDVRVRVSSAYSQWLRDDEAAARVGPRGVRPEAHRERARSLSGWGPGGGGGGEGGEGGWGASASDLFDWLRSRAGPETLTRIANADYGMDAEKHLAALTDICGTGLVPKRLGWEPHEVLALTRWSTGETADHLARALCCTLLSLAPSDFDELVTNGPILAESCLALGAEATHRAELFFAWLAETEAGDAGDDGPEQPLALLLLLLLRTASTPNDPRLGALAERLVDHPAYDLGEVAEWIAESMRSDLWTDLLDRILVPVRANRPATARVLEGLGR